MSLTPLDDAYLSGIFDELGKLDIQLDADPLIYGPKRLNQKVALARQMLTRCERLFLDASQRHAMYKRTLRAAELLLSLEMKRLLANDPEVRAGRAVSEREAIATGKLKTEVEDVAQAQQAIEDLDAVMTVIKAKRSDLRDLQGRLRDQIRLCQEEIGLGGRWGSKSPRGVELQPGQGFADGDDIEAINKVMQSVRGIKDAEVHLPAEVDASDPEEEEVADLMAAADTPSEGEEDGEEEGEDGGDEDVPNIVSGDSLVQEFGFVPHCDQCGEPQYRTPSGMTCPNGHGGCVSVPPPTGLLEEVAGTGAIPALVDTADPEEVTSFLASVPSTPNPVRKSRFQIEEEDGMDLDSLLAKF